MTRSIDLATMAAPMIDNLRALAMVAEPAHWRDGSDWYALAHRIACNLAREFGLQPDTVAGVIAALSPRNKWARNLLDARAVCNWARDTRQPVPSVCTFNSNRDKALAIAAGDSWRGVLSGIKVESFIANIAYADYNRVTVDVWAIRAATLGALDAVGSVARYRAAEFAYQTVAAEYGIEPAQFQAVVWLVAKATCDALPTVKAPKGADKATVKAVNETNRANREAALRKLVAA